MFIFFLLWFLLLFNNNIIWELNEYDMPLGNLLFCKYARSLLYWLYILKRVLYCTVNIFIDKYINCGKIMQLRENNILNLLYAVLFISYIYRYIDLIIKSCILKWICVNTEPLIVQCSLVFYWNCLDWNCII